MTKLWFVIVSVLGFASPVLSADIGGLLNGNIGSVAIGMTRQSFQIVLARNIHLSPAGMSGAGLSIESVSDLRRLQLDKIDDINVEAVDISFTGFGLDDKIDVVVIGVNCTAVQRTMTRIKMGGGIAVFANTEHWKMVGADKRMIIGGGQKPVCRLWIREVVKGELEASAN